MISCPHDTDLCQGLLYCHHDTFAASRDLVHWTKWTGSHLIEPYEPWDLTYAHKPWVVKWRGTVYHFYRGVGDQGRTIALARSRPLPR